MHVGSPSTLLAVPSSLVPPCTPHMQAPNYDPSSNRPPTRGSNATYHVAIDLLWRDQCQITNFHDFIICWTGFPPSGPLTLSIWLVDTFIMMLKGNTHSIARRGGNYIVLKVSATVYNTCQSQYASRQILVWAAIRVVLHLAGLFQVLPNRMNMEANGKLETVYYHKTCNTQLCCQARYAISIEDDTCKERV